MKTMNTTHYPWLNEYLLSKPGAEKDYKEEWAWHRYMVRGKLFAAICQPEEKHKVYGGRPLINLKCDPRMAEGIRETYPELVLPGFYSDKRHWNAVFLDGDLPDEVLRDFCDLSYRLIVEKLPKYVQKELAEGQG